MIPVPREKIHEYTRKGWWGHRTVPDLFFETAQKRPDAEALVDPLNRGDLIGGDAKRLTYREAAILVDRLAMGFERLGIQKDDVILVQLPNVVESVLVFFAAARIGAISSPLSMMARSREVGHALDATRAVAVVTVARFNGFDHLGLMKEMKGRFDSLKQIILAVGVPDERLGERTCVFVVAAPGHTITLEEIVRYLEGRGGAKYKYPERLEILDQLPRSALNKVLRRKLRDMVNQKICKKTGKEQS